MNKNAMSSFLIDKNSPIRSFSNRSGTGLHHRSRHFESDPNDLTTPGSKETDDQVQGATTKMEKKTDKGPSMFSYFKSELTRSYKLEGNASEFVQRRDRIYTSVNTPKSLEKFCAFGILQCLDSILNIMTFLPLRIIVALFHVLTYPCAALLFRKKAVLNPAQICDLLKGLILIISCFITSYIDTSMVYHIVRVQSIIKFYVIYNMLDVMDKLVSGFGQDVLDSLYWTAVEPRGRRREHFGTIFHLMFAIAYVVIHTTLILIQAITLNVAFNSQNKNLLTIMLSNNFIEIKANLFKRLDKNTLCQITYGDVKERFHYFVLLMFVFIHNLMEKNWLRDKALIYLVDALIVLGAEVIVDWIKHSFITKINEFSPKYYSDFAIGLAQDIASSQKKHAFTDFSDQVCRRMGFTPIPLTCLLYMVCRKSFEITGMVSWLLIGMLYLCLFTTKVLNSIILLGWAQHLITQGEKDSKSAVMVGNSQVMPKKEEKKSDKVPKAESISHCPDITSSLVTPRTTITAQPIGLGEQISSPQSSSLSHSSVNPLQPLQTFLSPTFISTESNSSESLIHEECSGEALAKSETPPVSSYSKLPQNMELEARNDDFLLSEIHEEEKEIVFNESDLYENKEIEDSDVYSDILNEESQDCISEQQHIASDHSDFPDKFSSWTESCLESVPTPEPSEPFMLKLSSSRVSSLVTPPKVDNAPASENGKNVQPADSYTVSLGGDSTMCDEATFSNSQDSSLSSMDSSEDINKQFSEKTSVS